MFADASLLQDDIIACEPEQYQKCVSLFGPVYTALVNAMLAKSMLDPKDEEWTADQREQLRCYRTDIADTIMYSFNILRCDNIIIIITRRHHRLSIVQGRSAALPAAAPGLLHQGVHQQPRGLATTGGLSTRMVNHYSHHLTIDAKIIF